MQTFIEFSPVDVQRVVLQNVTSCRGSKGSNWILLLKIQGFFLNTVKNNKPIHSFQTPLNTSMEKKNPCSHPQNKLHSLVFIKLQQTTKRAQMEGRALEICVYLNVCELEVCAPELPPRLCLIRPAVFPCIRNQGEVKLCLLPARPPFPQAACLKPTLCSREGVELKPHTRI